jgi:trehalose/maltose hydrolase-like predicted phosphorylase
MHDALQLTPDHRWVLTHKGYDIQSESVIESRFAFGNGFMGMRAARCISRGATWTSWLGYIRWASWPRCYVAGLFDVPNMEPPIPALVPVADWSRLRILLDGEPLLQREGEVQPGSSRNLDMRRGALVSTWKHLTPAGICIAGSELRLLSMADRAIGLQVIEIELDRDGVDVRLEASFAMAYGGDKQGCGDGRRRDAACGRRATQARTAIPASLDLAMAFGGGTSDAVRSPDRHGPRGCAR